MCDITWCGEYFITDIHQIKVVKLVHQLTATDKVICEQKERTSNSSRDFGKGLMCMMHTPVISIVVKICHTFHAGLQPIASADNFKFYIKFAVKDGKSLFLCYPSTKNDPSP